MSIGGSVDLIFTVRAFNIVPGAIDHKIHTSWRRRIGTLYRLRTLGLLACRADSNAHVKRIWWSSCAKRSLGERRREAQSWGVAARSATDLSAARSASAGYREISGEEKKIEGPCFPMKSVIWTAKVRHRKAPASRAKAARFARGGASRCQPAEGLRGH